MTVYIHRLETSVPETYYEQPFACELMQRSVSDREAVKRVLRSIYHNSGIRKRHSVITDLNGPDGPPLFFQPDGTRTDPPGTRRRNEIYTREARRHFTDLGDKLLRGTPGIQPEDVTHLITVSCTGFFAPGPDYFAVRDLGLRSSTERYHIGFMGCYAAFQGLKMAQSFCRNNPDAVVLVLCVELCTLHLQFSDETDAMISASVFADGGSGALVSARPPAGTTPFLEMRSFHSDLTPDGEGDMAWTIGNHGFEMRLSTYVPDIIRANIGPALDTILGGEGLTRRDITRWAVHPGGRAILDKVQEALGLDDEQIAASRTILREYGNMSSATILFVLKELVDAHRAPDPRTVFAMAFGPGLTIETGLFRLVTTQALP
jgi:predicted naringenin-chalcone synthase